MYLEEILMYFRKNLYFAEGCSTVLAQRVGPMPLQDAEQVCLQFNSYPTTTVPFVIVKSLEMALVVYAVEYQGNETEITEVFTSYKAAKDKADEFATKNENDLGCRYGVKCMIVEDTRCSIYSDF